MNLPNKTTAPESLPVAAHALIPASPFPAAQATCAADALLLPTRADLNQHWLKTIPPYSAVRAWHDFIQWLDTQKITPALN